ncbi:MAG: DUF4435 domain-containing protein [Methanothrix sp.]|nr:DUF4435 domain-containing protein [Methanothrix sp.]
MDLLREHANALDSSAGAFHEFLQYYDARKQVVYGFVEGKTDPPFYRGLIDNALPYGWKVKLIGLGNKDKVLRTYSKMDWSRFAKNRVCFFVDRDLSEFLGESYHAENIYVTDKYSIENEFVTFNTMERILEDIFGVIDLTPAEIDLVKNLFESNLRIFSEAMVPVMAQIILWKRGAMNVNLSNIIPKEYFDFNQGRIELKEAFISSNNRINHAAQRVAFPASSDDDIAAAEVEFRKKEGVEKYIRGKYILWFFIKSIFEISEVIPLLCPRYKVAPKNRIALGPKTATIVISGSLKCPESLKTFIELNFIKYIRDKTIAS